MQRPVLLFAHGAGGHMDDGAVLAAARALGEHFEVVRFNFPYRAAGGRRPDPMPVLRQAFEDQVARHRVAGRPLLVGGRSMGGRVASMMAADGFAAQGLVLLAYPLHPAGQPGKLRDAHLPRIRMPVLCLNGTRDALCTRELMDGAVAGREDWTMRWLDGADHSFHVLKRSGRTGEEVLREVAQAAGSWWSKVRERT